MLKKLVICLLVAATLLGSGLYVSTDHVMARHVNEYEGQH